MVEAPLNIFISYSSKDKPFAIRLRDDLLAKGFHPWLDESELKGGQKWLDEIQKAIDRCHILLVVLTPDSLQSDYVQMEYRQALRKEKLVIPLDYLPVPDVPMDLPGLQWVNFQASYEVGLYNLLNSLRQADFALSSSPLSVPEAPKVSFDSFQSHPQSLAPNLQAQKPPVGMNAPTVHDNSVMKQPDHRIRIRHWSLIYGVAQLFLGAGFILTYFILANFTSLSSDDAFGRSALLDSIPAILLLFVSTLLATRSMGSKKVAITVFVAIQCILWALGGVVVATVGPLLLPSFYGIPVSIGEIGFTFLALASYAACAGYGIGPLGFNAGKWFYERRTRDRKQGKSV